MSNNKLKINNDINIAVKSLRFFIPIAWREKKSYFILMMINLISNSVLPFVDILVLPMIIDELIRGRRVERVVTYVAILVLGNALLGRVSSYSSMKAGQYSNLYDNSLNELLIRRTMEMDFSLTENKEALDQIQKAKEGISWYSGGIPGIITPFLDIIKNILVISGVVILIAVYAPFMLAITLVIVFLHALINRVFMRIETESFKNLSKLNRSFGYTLFELLDFKYAKDIRLYGAVNMMMEKTKKEINGLTAVWKKQANTALPWYIIDSFISSANTGIMYLYLGVLVILRKISIGTFSQMIAAISTFTSSITNIVYSVQNIIKRSAYANEFIKFMDYPPVMQKGDIVPATTEPIIEFKAVSFTYPGTQVKVLDCISITIRSGEHLSIVGLNGAGKTTFVKILCRLYDVDEGEILLDGVNIKDYSYDEYMKLFSVVFQDFKLLAFSIKENILLDQEATEEEIRNISSLAGIEEKVASLEKGIDTIIFKSFDKDGIELSGGEQQKIAIARAFYKNSPIVILDEPTAALDPIAEYEIYRQFDKLVGGKTAIYISHRLSSCKFCDRIAVFADAKIKEYGTHDELVQKDGGIYAEMFTAQAQYYR